MGSDEISNESGCRLGMSMAMSIGMGQGEGGGDEYWDEDEE